jgi:hydroxymethylpyrimidine/phosphomethylpyrimidine kinase
MSRPRILTIAGIDPCGGAGLGADARTIHVCGGVAMTVPTATTVQNRLGFVRARPIPAVELSAMLEAVAGDGLPAAAKLGLCADAATVAAVASWLRGLGAAAPPLVVDPVLSATAGGGPAAAAEVAAALVEQLAGLAAVFTPNLPELELLGGLDRLRAAGCAAVLVTDGHGDGAEVVDRLVTAAGCAEIRHPRLPSGPVHGTGCALSAALATALGRGDPLERACADAVGQVARWLAGTAPSTDGRPVPLAVG